MWTAWREGTYLAFPEHWNAILLSYNLWSTQYTNTNSTNIFSSSTGFRCDGVTTNDSVPARTDCRWRTAIQLLIRTDCMWSTSTQLQTSTNYRWRTATQLLTRTNCSWRTATKLLTRTDCRWRTANKLLTCTDCRWRTAIQLLTRTGCRWHTSIQLLTRTDCRWRTATHLRVSVSRRVPTHGLNIQKYRLVCLMVQNRRSANGASHWVDAEVTIRVAGVYGVPHRTSGPWKKNSFCHYKRTRVSLRNISFT